MRRRQVTAIVALTGLLGASPAAAPTPKVIIEVRTSALCQVLHEAVRPTLAGLMKNDSLLEAANRAIAPSDETSGPLLRNVVVAVAHNLDTVSQLLGHQFPQDANPSMHASAVLIKARLQMVASAQNDALNLIEGYIQTADMGRARDEFPGGHQSGANEVEAPGVDSQGYNAEFHNADDPPTPPVDIAGMQGNMPHAVAKSSVQAGNRAALLAQTRSRIGSLEDAAGVAIMTAAQLCSSPQPQATSH